MLSLKRSASEKSADAASRRASSRMRKMRPNDEATAAVSFAVGHTQRVCFKCTRRGHSLSLGGDFRSNVQVRYYKLDGIGDLGDIVEVVERIVHLQLRAVGREHIV
nr:uncharacterized protein CTRU02_04652 [Colletotrichum truncatum]KAF6795089.1 hypothetical protein CTRU02_04652 [Colletotrichum truncatum]